MKRILLAIATTCMITEAGCQSPPRYPSFGDTRSRLMMTTEPDRYPAATLFDREPGWYSAEAFNGRSEWPYVDGAYSTGQVTSYEATLYDYQGHGHHDGDHIHRRAVTRKHSITYR